MKKTDLHHLGWERYITNHNITIPENHTIGRIAAQYNELYSVLSSTRELQGMLTGAFYHSGEDFPVVGDWVLIQEIEGEEKCVISEILPRRTELARKRSASKATQQVIAANLDIVFIVQGLDHDFNIRRLERYLLMCGKSGIEPIIILNKSDLCQDPTEVKDKMDKSLKNATFYEISALCQKGLEKITQHLAPGVTAALVGSSGAGKSTLTNALLGSSVQVTKNVREDDSKGRHATTVRQMFILASGALLIDTPGMRELEPWDALDSIDDIFDDITALSKGCYFKNCTHNHEPDCKVREAIEEGTLDSKRLKNYQKMLREQDFQRMQADEKGHLERKRKEKEFGKMCKRIISQKKR